MGIGIGLADEVTFVVVIEGGFISKRIACQGSSAYGIVFKFGTVVVFVDFGTDTTYLIILSLSCAAVGIEGGDEAIQLIIGVLCDVAVSVGFTYQVTFTVIGVIAGAIVSDLMYPLN